MSIVFIASNPRHHFAMMLPVLTELHKTSKVKLLSLCEFRGLATPEEKLKATGITYQKVLNRNIRGSPGKAAALSTPWQYRKRKLMREIAWLSLLGPKFSLELRNIAAAVVPNDNAFPYNKITQLLQRRKIPFVLVQEGIRFPLPNAPIEGVYGKGGAAAIAAWGKTSEEYFVKVGAPSDSIHVTGNPQFDTVLSKDWTEEANGLQKKFGLGSDNLLVLSNPIDDQGFCTTDEKLLLLREFVSRLAPLCSNPNFTISFKLHARESVSKLREVLQPLSSYKSVRILEDSPLYPSFKTAKAAVVLASTVGLEALLFHLPLGVLEIPKHGFVHDYVQRGGGMGLTLSDELPSAVINLMSQWNDSRGTSISHYVEDSLAFRGDSKNRITALVNALSTA